MNNLKDIHNLGEGYSKVTDVVLSGFQWTIWRIYTTIIPFLHNHSLLFYQDFNEQFEGYTQRLSLALPILLRCFIRISMNNLKDIHNRSNIRPPRQKVVLSGFQWTIWRIYTTHWVNVCRFIALFYQDFNEQFEGYTQPISVQLHTKVRCFIRISMNNLKDIHNVVITWLCLENVVLSGFQWTIWRIYTTKLKKKNQLTKLFYQDFNEQFEGYTQHYHYIIWCNQVVLSGFQWTIWRIYTTNCCFSNNKPCCFIRISMNNLKDIHNR